MKIRILFVGVVLGSVCAGSVGLADGFRNPPDGATSLGRIGGTYAQIDDASAVSRNPANLADITNVQYEASVTLGWASKKFTRSADAAAASGSSETTAETKDNFAALPDLYAAIPIDDGLAGGIAITTPFGRSTTWEKDSLFRYTAPYYSRLFAINANPNLAMKLGERVSVAAGVDLLWSQLEIKQIFPWALVTGNPAARDGEMRFKGDGFGIGGNAALNFELTDAQKITLSYRSPVKIEYEGDTTVTEIPEGAGAAMGVSSRSDLSSEITFPAVAALGYGIHVTDSIRIEANIEWVQHSTFKELSVDAGNNSALLGDTATTRADWEDTWTYGLGADWRFAPAWIARLGWMHLPTPIPESTLIPSVAEEDQDVLSAGLGWSSGAHRVDLAYVYGIFDGRTVNENDNPAYNGKYDFESHLLAISYALAF